MEINTDKMVELLKNDLPLNVTMVEEYGKDKLVCLFALPHLIDKIEKFALDLLEEYKKEDNYETPTTQTKETDNRNDSDSSVKSE